MFTKEDFKERFGGIYIQEKGRETFFKAYIGKIQSEILHPLFEYRVSYRRVFEIQARLLAKFIKGEIEEYIPFALR
jgi:CRISPR-associated protein Cas1